MAKKKEEVAVDMPTNTWEYGTMTIDKSSVCITDDAIYTEIKLLPNDLETTDEVLSDKVAYLKGDYFYLFRGIGNSDTAYGKKPGVYRNKHGFPKYFVVDPVTSEEKEDYAIANHINSLHPTSIIDSANTKEDLLVAIPESTKIFQPQITENDDILKLIAKKALLAKNVDLDRYRDRFSNKNELFNLKQVIRGDNKVSMRIFTRVIEALNLKFEIILTERTKDDIVGDALKDPIKVSSEETFAI